MATGVVVLTGCAAKEHSPSGSQAEVGTRIEGSVQIVEDGQRDCWAVRYTEGDSTVEAPLRVPEGYVAADIAMADPMNPGEDYPGPALMDPTGQPVAFAGTGVIVAGTYGAVDDPTWADDAERCGWDSAPLVADADGGLMLDPDGLSTVTLVCRNADPAAGVEGDAPAPIDPDDCVRVTQEPWNND